MNSLMKIAWMMVLMVSVVHAQRTIADQFEALAGKKQKKKPAKLVTHEERVMRRLGKKKVPFSYKDKDIADVILEIAGYKKINVIVPQGKDALKGKLNIQLAAKITVDQAWNLLLSILEAAGFSMQPKGTMYQLVPKEKSYEFELPFYVNTKPEDLPHSDQRIRYVYYFTNIMLSDTKQKENIQSILKDMLEEKAEGQMGGAGAGETKYLLDEHMNVLMITSPASRIRMIMKILGTLDQSGFRESVEVMTLLHVPAELIETLFAGDKDDKDKKGGLIALKSSEPQFPSWMQPEKKAVARKRYFSESTRIVALKNNMVVIFGKEDAIEKVRDFIHKYVDVPLESAASVVHIKDLQFIEAKSAAEAIDGLLKGEEKKQAKGEAGPVKDFDFKNVVIYPEVSEKVESKGPEPAAGDTAKEGLEKETKPQGSYLGGNRLIVAAREREWHAIERLIDDLDYAESQVALEALIIDITMDDARALGAQIRNKLFENLISQDVNFQSAHLDTMWLNFDANDNIKSPPGLAADLLSTEKVKNINPQNQNADATTTIPATLTPSASGSTVVTVSETANNGKEIVWAIMQMLNQYTNSRVISHPFVVAVNNKSAKLVNIQKRWVVGDSTQQGSGTKIQREELNAGITITIQPRVSGLTSDVGLEITIDVDEFIGEPSETNPRRRRNIQTNALVKDGQVLMLGGLDKIDEREAELITPVLGRIPLIGWLFKKKQRVRRKQTLMVFIVPHIIRPYYGKIKEGYVSTYSRTKLQIAGQEFSDRDFVRDHDPITRTFFEPISQDACYEMKNFVASTRWKSDRKREEKIKGDCALVEQPKQKKSMDQLKDIIAHAPNPLAQRTDAMPPAATL